MNRFTQLAGRVREHLGQEHRYRHCVRVARMSENLARIHGVDPRKARLAGMLHDLARLYSSQRLLEESAERGIPIDDYAREHPIVLHAPLSARLAAELFEVEDPEIASAIAKHTLGSGEMSALDCILYLADGLEPGRDYEERAALAALAERDLRQAMRATIASSLRYLTQRQLPVAPQTAAAMTMLGMTGSLEILDIVRAAALDKKAEEFLEIDVAGRTILADKFVIITGRSKVQTRSIADSISEKVEEHGLKVSRVEGYADGNWILIDLGNVVVHVFTPEQRSFYNLERLWAAGKEQQASFDSLGTG